MEKIPFGVYDFFAYLSAGAVILATADYVSGPGLLGLKEVGLVLAIALVILAYVLGQVVAQFSSAFFEHFVVGRIIGRPAAFLLGQAPRYRVAAWIFRNHHRPLPANIQRRVHEQAQSRGCTANDEGLFLHAFPIVTQNEKIQARLDVFLNLYGFARNMAFAFMVSSLAITIAHWYGPHPVRLRWAVLAGVGAVSMFYRYLKFFRQYSYELFVRYAELPPAESKAKSVGA